MEALPTSLHGGHLLQPSAPGAVPCQAFPLLLSLTCLRCNLFHISWTCAGDVSPCGGGELVVVESWCLWRGDGCRELASAVCAHWECDCSVKQPAPPHSCTPPEMPARLVAWPTKGPTLEKCSALPLMPPEQETTQGNISTSKQFCQFSAENL